jgi:predicted membrane protein
MPGAAKAFGCHRSQYAHQKCVALCACAPNIKLRRESAAGRRSAQSALRGLVGVLIASAASYVLARVMGVPHAIDTPINVLALLFSAFIGVVFGYFTARRAAQMDPIEALRHE